HGLCDRWVEGGRAVRVDNDRLVALRDHVLDLRDLTGGITVRLLHIGRGLAAVGQLSADGTHHLIAPAVVDGVIANTHDPRAGSGRVGRRIDFGNGEEGSGYSHQGRYPDCARALHHV